MWVMSTGSGPYLVVCLWLASSMTKKVRVTFKAKMGFKFIWSASTMLLIISEHNITIPRLSMRKVVIPSNKSPIKCFPNLETEGILLSLKMCFLLCLLLRELFKNVVLSSWEILNNFILIVKLHGSCSILTWEMKWPRSGEALCTSSYTEGRGKMGRCSNSKRCWSLDYSSFIIWTAGDEGSLIRGRLIACLNTKFVTCMHFKLQIHFS